MSVFANTWDNTATVNSTFQQFINGQGVVVATINIAGSITGGIITFEASDDGVTWYLVPGLVQSTFAIFTTWQPSFGSSVSYQFTLQGFNYFRFRLSTVLVGTGNVTTQVSPCNLSFQTVSAVVQQFGPNLHMVLDDSSGAVTANVTAKGTQGTNGLATQDLKDSGRVIKVYSGTFTGTVAEGLITLTPITDGTAGGTGTSFTVTAGKRFRIQTILLSTKNAGAAIQGSVVNLRMSVTGAVTTTSPLVATVAAGTISATANNANAEAAPIPDGLELSGSMQFGLSQLGTATAGNTVTLIGYEY